MDQWLYKVNGEVDRHHYPVDRDTILDKQHYRAWKLDFYAPFEPRAAHIRKPIVAIITETASEQPNIGSPIPADIHTKLLQDWRARLAISMEHFLNNLLPKPLIGLAIGLGILVALVFGLGAAEGDGPLNPNQIQTIWSHPPAATPHAPTTAPSLGK